MLMIVQWAQQNQAMSLDSTTMQFQKYAMYAMPPLALLVISWAPAAVQLHFVTTSGMAILTNVFLKMPAVRSWMKITQMPKEAPKTSSPQTPYKGTINVRATSSATPTSAPASTSSSASSTTGNVSSVGKSPARGGMMSRLTEAASRRMKKIAPDFEDKAKAKARKNEVEKANRYEEKRRKQIEEERVDHERDQQIRRKRR